MYYIPGQIHESFQKSHYYFLKFDFTWSNCTKRYSEFNDISDWDNYTDHIKLYGGDIIQVKFFKCGQFSSTYCYLEKVIFRNGDEKIYNTETLISLSFLEVNKEILFQSADKIINRDNKINTLLSRL
jgi:hypothetical protein